MLEHKHAWIAKVPVMSKIYLMILVTFRKLLMLIFFPEY